MPLAPLLPILCVGAFLAVLIPLEAMTAVAPGDERTKAAEKNSVKIRSLDQEDVRALKQGSGASFADAAELNGVPGPASLLELKDRIPLDADQIKALQALDERTTEEAQKEGRSYLAQEAKLEEEFRSGNINDGLLQTALGYIEESRRKLRYIHLSAHLQTLTILRPEQIDRYNELRSRTQSATGPCSSLPRERVRERAGAMPPMLASITTMPPQKVAYAVADASLSPAQLVCN